MEILQAPEFNITPISKRYPLARTVRLDCQANGFPIPDILWYKDGKQLSLFGRIKQGPTGLVLSHSFTSDTGNNINFKNTIIKLIPNNNHKRIQIL